MTQDRHIQITPSVLYVGTPVALITSLNTDGSCNISPMSSAWALGDRVVLGMSSSSQGRENVIRTRELVINFPDATLWQQVESIARATGRNPVPLHKQKIGYSFEPDKFKLSGLTAQQSQLVKPMRIAECPIQFEAQVMAAHDRCGESSNFAEGFQIVETRVMCVHAHRDIVIPGTQHIDTDKWSPLLYVFRHYFGTASDLGRTFKAEA